MKPKYFVALAACTAVGFIYQVVRFKKIVNRIDKMCDVIDGVCTDVIEFMEVNQQKEFDEVFTSIVEDYDD